jgi:hypothetical protein
VLPSVGKSKLITTLTEGTSIPLAIRFDPTRVLNYPFLKLSNTLVLS